MNDLLKMADLFERQVSSDIFGKPSYSGEAKALSLLAGKIHYLAKNEKDAEKAKRVLIVAKMLLEAADILKSV